MISVTGFTVTSNFEIWPRLAAIVILCGLKRIFPQLGFLVMYMCVGVSEKCILKKNLFLQLVPRLAKNISIFLGLWSDYSHTLYTAYSEQLISNDDFTSIMYLWV